jgi:hypothetical protein
LWAKQETRILALVFGQLLEAWMLQYGSVALSDRVSREIRFT